MDKKLQEYDRGAVDDEVWIGYMVRKRKEARLQERLCERGWGRGGLGDCEEDGH